MVRALPASFAFISGRFVHFLARVLPPGMGGGGEGGGLPPLFSFISDIFPLLGSPQNRDSIENEQNRDLGLYRKMSRTTI